MKTIVALLFGIGMLLVSSCSNYTCPTYTKTSTPEQASENRI
ncbi:MAG: hypothetical protein WAU36_12860 [Cyclobacteriaceae bacterium]